MAPPPPPPGKDRPSRFSMRPSLITGKCGTLIPAEIALRLLVNFASQIGACPLQLDDNQGCKSVPVPPVHIAMPNGAWTLRGTDATSEVFVQHPQLVISQAESMATCRNRFGRHLRRHNRV